MFAFGNINPQSLPFPQVVTDPENEWLEIIIMIRCSYCFLIQSWMTSNGAFSPCAPFPVQTHPQGSSRVRPWFPAPTRGSPGLVYQHLCKHVCIWTHHIHRCTHVHKSRPSLDILFLCPARTSALFLCTRTWLVQKYVIMWTLLCLIYSIIFFLCQLMHVYMCVHIDVFIIVLKLYFKWFY